jgi:hypothetical protein
MRLSFLPFALFLTLLASTTFAQVSNDNINFELEYYEFFSSADGDGLFTGEDDIQFYIETETSSFGWDYQVCEIHNCDVPCTFSGDYYIWQYNSPYTETINLYVTAWEDDDGTPCSYSPTGDELKEEGFAILDNPQITGQVGPLTWGNTFGNGNSQWVLPNHTNYDMKIRAIWGYANGHNFADALNFGNLVMGSPRSHVNSNRSAVSGLNNPLPIGYENVLGNSASDVFYQFTLNETANVTISTDDGITNYDSFLRLYDSNQDLITFNDDLPSCSGCASEINIDLCPGTYYVLVEGYTFNEGDFKLTVDAFPIGPFTVGGVVEGTACLNNDGSVSLGTTGGISPISYNWSNGSTGAFISGLSEGSYTATVTDGCGTTTTFTAIIENLDQSPPEMVCQDINVEVTPTMSVEIFPSDIDDGSFDLCGMDYFTLSQTVFTNSDAGINTVTLTGYDVVGNSATCSATVTVTVNTSTITIDGLEEWKVFPNPNNGIFQLNLEVYNLNANSYLTITDLFGRQIVQQPARNGNQRFDLSQAAPGVYLLQLHHNGSVQTERIMVQ